MYLAPSQTFSKVYSKFGAKKEREISSKFGRRMRRNSLEYSALPHLYSVAIARNIEGVV